MTTLALDLSTRATGWAIGDDSPEAWGVITPEKKAGLIERWIYVAREVENLIEAYEPDLVVIEETHYSRNMKVLRALLGLRGIVLEMVGRREIKAESVNRLSVLKHLGLKRAQGKEAVIEKLKALGFEPNGEDDADALGVFLARHLAEEV